MANEGEADDDFYARRHLRAGWWSLFVFGLGGLVLEALHGFKVPAYLDASNEARRLMWTLAHAHGTLLGIVHLLFAMTVRVFPEVAVTQRRLVSIGLLGATLLLPGGFLLGGLAVYGGDPSLGALVVPFGAAFYLMAALLLARAANRFFSSRTTRGRGSSSTRGNRPS
jgi:hypothetical protein